MSWLVADPVPAASIQRFTHKDTGDLLCNGLAAVPAHCALQAACPWLSWRTPLCSRGGRRWRTPSAWSTATRSGGPRWCMATQVGRLGR